MTQFTPKGPMYCRSCEKNQIKTEIYFDNFHKSQSGKSIPLESFGGQPHQCPYSEYALKQNGQRMGTPEVVTTTMPFQPQQNITPVNVDLKSVTFDRIESKIDNVNIVIAKVMSMIQQAQENNPTVQENMRLRQQVTELEDVIKKQGNSFVPANQVKTEDNSIGGGSIIEYGPSELEDTTGYDNEVADKIRRGKQADDDGEELEI